MFQVQKKLIFSGFIYGLTLHCRQIFVLRVTLLIILIAEKNCHPKNT